MEVQPSLMKIRVSTVFVDNISESSSTLFVGLQYANTKFRPTFLETQACTCYTKSYMMTTSYLKSVFTFLVPNKNWKSISTNRQNLEILVISSLTS